MERPALSARPASMARAVVPVSTITAMDLGATTGTSNNKWSRRRERFIRRRGLPSTSDALQRRDERRAQGFPVLRTQCFQERAFNHQVATSQRDAGSLFRTIRFGGKITY